MSDTPCILKLRKLTEQYQFNCNCAGPQPSLGNDRLAEHAEKCPYRVLAESDTPTILTGR